MTWLIEGEALHNDSLGSQRMIRPGQLNLMTAGSGISHAEETPQSDTGRLHGLQLWVALPETRRHGPPAFDHYAELPVAAMGAVRATVLMGAPAGVRSPAAAYSRMIGPRSSPAVVAALDRTFEHALMVIDGDAALGDARDAGPMPE